VAGEALNLIQSLALIGFGGARYAETIFFDRE
jgi:hypothetical protein